MGVCALQHRIITGTYAPACCVRDSSSCKYKSGPGRFSQARLQIWKERLQGRACEDMLFVNTVIAVAGVLGVLLYVYLLCLLMAIFIEISFNQNFSSHVASGTYQAAYFYRNHLNNYCFLIIALSVFKNISEII